MVRYILDSLYAARVKHSLSVYTLKNMYGGIFSWYFICKKRFGTTFRFNYRSFHFIYQGFAFVTLLCSIYEYIWAV